MCSSTGCRDEACTDESPVFRCKLKSISFGYTYGQADWHGDTVSERAKRQVEEAKAAGCNPEPVGQRWV